MLSKVSDLRPRTQETPSSLRFAAFAGDACAVRDTAKTGFFKEKKKSTLTFTVLVKQPKFGVEGTAETQPSPVLEKLLDVCDVQCCLEQGNYKCC